MIYTALNICVKFEMWVTDHSRSFMIENGVDRYIIRLTIGLSLQISNNLTLKTL